MAEGKTNMFGKTYNTIGSTDSNFIIKTKGDLKVLWGNKYIDVIKNGKIASSGSAIIKAVATIEDIKKDGIYLVGEDLIWVSVNGNNINVSLEGSNVYVSFLVEQTNTADEKYRALTNIGFYYNTLEEAQSVISGIIYVEETLKLYIVNKGQLTPYTTGELETIINEDDSVTNVFEELLIGNLHLYNKNDYGIIDSATKMQISIKDIPYITLENGTVNLLVSLNVPPNLYLLSLGASNNTGFRLYTDGGESTLEIDNLVWRKYPIPVTFSELDSMIKEGRLKPKMYYLITDFQNPWEVSWDNEPMYYEDLYTEINEVKHLSGLRNAMQIIVLAVNLNNIDKLVWSPLHPEWIIHYDHTFKGPEHKIMVDGVEQTYYGYRTKTEEDGSVLYLPCKGRITYLKDEFENEGNFNFRQFMFEYQGKWRYCVDNTTQELFGKFGPATNNIFNINNLDIVTLVFDFEEIKNNEDIIGYNIKYKDDNEVISIGYKIKLLSINPVISNEFNLTSFPSEETLNINIESTNIKYNKFLEVCNNINIINTKFIKNTIKNVYYEYSNIRSDYDMQNNILENISGLVTVKGTMLGNVFRNLELGLLVNIDCLYNTINKFLDYQDLTIGGNKFDYNIILELHYQITNTGTITNNNINICKGSITNSGMLHNNNIVVIEDYYIDNSGTIQNNNIKLVNGDVINSGVIDNNNIFSIEEFFQNTNIINFNTINSINNFSNGMLIEENNIERIEQVYDGTGKLLNNTIKLLQETGINGIIQNSILGEIYTTYIYKDVNNTMLDYCNESTFDGILDNNHIKAFDEVYIMSDFKNNKIKESVSSTTFNGITNNNIVVDIISDCDLQEFIDNRVYNTFKNVYASDTIKLCIFNDPINELSCCKLINCTFDEINKLDLYNDVYYTTFHGLIGEPLYRDFTDLDWDLLTNLYKKKEAFPNIKIICIPEIYIPGMIIMWYGDIDSIPEGWYLCDGYNNTPDLKGKFIKATDDPSLVGDNERDPYIDSDNMLTLHMDHLPSHKHPHETHSHTVSFNPYLGETYNSGDLSIESSSEYINSIQEYTTSFVTDVSGEGVETVGTNKAVYEIDKSSDRVYSYGGDHTHSFEVNLENINTSEEESKEVEIDWQNQPIKIEPASYSLIFIMKGYDN